MSVLRISSVDVNLSLLIYYFVKEGTILFNDALNTFYLWLYGVGHIVKDHFDIESENPLPPLHGLLFSISSKRYYIYTIP